jgi:uncharacterized OB-fold protein
MAEIAWKEGLIHFPTREGEPPNLVGSKCRLCGYCSFPPKKVCLRCLRDDCMQEVKLGPRASLDSFAVMQIGRPGFPAPYIMAYVTSAEGAKIFTLVNGCEPAEDALEIGEEMEMVIAEIKEDSAGNKLMGWKFRPVR